MESMEIGMIFLKVLYVFVCFCSLTGFWPPCECVRQASLGIRPDNPMCCCCGLSLVRWLPIAPLKPLVSYGVSLHAICVQLCSYTFEPYKYDHLVTHLTSSYISIFYSYCFGWQARRRLRMLECLNCSLTTTYSEFSFHGKPWARLS